MPSKKGKGQVDGEGVEADKFEQLLVGWKVKESEHLKVANGTIQQFNYIIYQ